MGDCVSSPSRNETRSSQYKFKGVRDKHGNRYGTGGYSGSIFDGSSYVGGGGDSGGASVSCDGGAAGCGGGAAGCGGGGAGCGGGGGCGGCGG